MQEQFAVTTKSGLSEYIIFRYDATSYLPNGWYLTYEGKEMFLPARTIANLIESIHPDDHSRMSNLLNKVADGSNWQAWKPPVRTDEGTYVLNVDEGGEEVDLHLEELREGINRLLGEL